MGHTAIKGAPDHGAAGLEHVAAAKVLPKAQGNRREDQSRTAAPAEWGVVISLGIR
jgi:hypothetical protein